MRQRTATNILLKQRPKMSAYLVVQASLTDPIKFRDYTAQVPALIQRFGGRYIVLGGEQEAIESAQPPFRTVISEWPDRATALAFWHSPEYTAAKVLREGTGHFTVSLVDGLPTSV